MVRQWFFVLSLLSVFAVAAVGWVWPPALAVWSRWSRPLAMPPERSSGWAPSGGF